MLSVNVVKSKEEFAFTDHMQQSRTVVMPLERAIDGFVSASEFIAYNTFNDFSTQNLTYTTPPPV